MKEFGTDISSDDIIETLSFFDSWDDRYKYIIDLGRELPPLPESERNDNNIVRGCQSKVWLSSEQRDGRLYFYVDSDAFIVK
ncbi:SufE family protein, partial [Aliidiomarina sp.]|uniref:SufE family protein n=1 Tax=Aliidiomarina sp. TaxID=1872439 RepID=UPI003A4DA4EA